MGRWYECSLCTRTRLCSACRTRGDALRAMLQNADISLHDITYHSIQATTHGDGRILHIYHRRDGRERHTRFLMNPTFAKWELGVVVDDMRILDMICTHT